MVVYQLVKTRLKYGEITRNAVMDIDRLGVMAPISSKESAGKRGQIYFQVMGFPNSRVDSGAAKNRSRAGHAHSRYTKNF